MLIAHGRFDHIHDALEIAKATKPKIVSNFEITSWLGSKGVDGETLIGGNQGGTIDVGAIKITLVHAEHSRGISDAAQLLHPVQTSPLRHQFQNLLPPS